MLRAPHKLTQRLLGVLVGLGLLLQPLAVPLHLALADHTHGPASDAAFTAHAHQHEHQHPHTHPHPHAPADGLAVDDGEDGDSHPPHPAEDHLGEQQDLHPAPPSPDFGALAMPVGDPGAWDELFAAPVSQCPARVPLRPPPRASARPRAPPAIV